MTFMYPVCEDTEIDIDDLIGALESADYLQEVAIKFLGRPQVALLKFIVSEGLRDIRGQEPMNPMPPEEDDPLAKPNPDYGIMPPIFEGDDPFAKPSKPSDGEKPNPDNPEEGSGEGEDDSSNPYLNDWNDFWQQKHPGEDVPPMPQSSADEYWEEFAEYLSNKYGDVGIG